MNAGQDDTMIAIHETALNKIGDVLITLQDETIKRMSDALEAAEARAESLAESNRELSESVTMLRAELENSGAAYVAKCYTVTELQRINAELITERTQLEAQLAGAESVVVTPLERIIARQKREIEELKQGLWELEEETVWTEAL